MVGKEEKSVPKKRGLARWFGGGAQKDGQDAAAPDVLATADGKAAPTADEGGDPPTVMLDAADLEVVNEVLASQQQGPPPLASAARAERRPGTGPAETGHGPPPLASTARPERGTGLIAEARKRAAMAKLRGDAPAGGTPHVAEQPAPRAREGSGDDDGGLGSATMDLSDLAMQVLSEVEPREVLDITADFDADEEEEQTIIQQRSVLFARMKLPPQMMAALSALEATPAAVRRRADDLAASTVAPAEIPSTKSTKPTPAKEPRVGAQLRRAQGDAAPMEPTGVVAQADPVASRVRQADPETGGELPAKQRRGAAPSAAPKVDRQGGVGGDPQAPAANRRPVRPPLPTAAALPARPQSIDPAPAPRSASPAPAPVLRELTPAPRPPASPAPAPVLKEPAPALRPPASPAPVPVSREPVLREPAPAPVLREPAPASRSAAVKSEAGPTGAAPGESNPGLFNPEAEGAPVAAAEPPPTAESVQQPTAQAPAPAAIAAPVIHLADDGKEDRSQPLFEMADDGVAASAFHTPEDIHERPRQGTPYPQLRTDILPAEAQRVGRTSRDYLDPAEGSVPGLRLSLVTFLVLLALAAALTLMPPGWLPFVGG